MPEKLIIFQGDGRVLTPEEESSLAERERYLSDVVDASDRAIAAVQTILAGESPDLAALEAGAAVLEDFARGKVAGPRPITEGDVAVTRHLIDLVRTGAPKEDVLTAAREVMRCFGLAAPPSAPTTPGSGRG